MKHQLLRRILAICAAIITLWIAFSTARSTTLTDAITDLRGSGDWVCRLVQWELGDFFGTDLLSAVNVLTLGQSPHLLSQRSQIVSLMAQSPQQPKTEDSLPQAETVTPPVNSISSGDLTFADNGAPSQTVIPSGSSYTVVGNTYIKNTSSRTLDSAALAANTHQSKLTGEGPQVLIIHSHGSEAYTMPAGQEYTATGTYRTDDTNYNVVRIGDEIAAVLSEYGISVLHDRTLHDVPSYNDAYNSSLAAVEDYLAKYPTLVYVLDIHRDAIQDSDGTQYKLIAQEDSRAAQCCFVLGMVSDRWAENMSLAIAVQETLMAQSPTLMRPIAARGYRYNQHLPIDSLLVEVGAAGNSLDEALFSARIFAKCFAETLLPS